MSGELRRGDHQLGARILVLTSDLGGGTGNHLLSLVDHWKADGAVVEVVSFDHRTARREAAVRHTRLPVPTGPRVYPFRQISRFLQVRDLLKDRRPDLVHAYFFWPILYARILKAVGLVPRLVENREDEGFAWGRHEYAWLRLTRRVPDRVVCVSRAVQRVVHLREGLDARRTTVIHNGVEFPEDVAPARVAAAREEIGVPDGAPVVGMVANLNRAVKGVGRLLDAAPQILDRVARVHFLIVGGGTGERRLRARAHEQGLESRIHFTGYREDVDVFYEAMDVSVLTSTSEGLSITLLESMSHELPVVATRVGGNPEIVEDGHTGFLVPLDDADAFVAAVVRLLKDPELRRRMGRTGRERVASEFGLSRTARSYERLYSELLSGG